MKTNLGSQRIQRVEIPANQVPFLAFAFHRNEITVYSNPIQTSDDNWAFIQAVMAPFSNEKLWQVTTKMGQVRYRYYRGKLPALLSHLARVKRLEVIRIHFNQTEHASDDEIKRAICPVWFRSRDLVYVNSFSSKFNNFPLTITPPVRAARI